MVNGTKEYFKSKRWLYKKYVVEQWSQQKIAAYCETSQVQIHRYLKKFEII
jgi:hypothetical protein